MHNLEIHYMSHFYKNLGVLGDDILIDLEILKIGLKINKIGI